MKKQSSQKTHILDHHLRLVGELVNNAALCDALLFSAFHIILGCENKVARAIYFSTESVSSKINIVRRTLVAINNPEDDKIIQRIISAVEKAHKQRSELCHALLKVEGDKLFGHNPHHQVQPNKRITKNCLSSLSKLSSEPYIEAHVAFQELCQKRGIPPKLFLE